MYDVALTASYFPAQADAEVRDTTIASILKDAAKDRGGATALVEIPLDGSAGRRWTYASLLADAERLARSLAARFAPGERIAVWAPNIPEWTLLEFASAFAGLVLVTVNPAYQAQELHYVLRQSRAAGLFLIKSFRGNPLAEIAARVCAELPAIRATVDMEDADAFFGGAKAAALPSVSPNDAAMIQYTSGTTGVPKGAVLHHRGLTNVARLVMRRLDVTDADRYLNFMPMFHASSCAIALLGAVQARAPLFVARLFEPARMIDAITCEKLTVAMAVPTMMLGLLEAQARNGRDVSSLRLVMAGGAMVPPELVRRVERELGADVSIAYGQTETSAGLTLTRPDDGFEDKTQTAGQPLPQTEICIREAGGDAVVPVGAVGEICARGYCNMIGYNDDDDATAKTIDAEGWLHTGDLGSMDARGYVKVTGRVKDMIIRGGENLFPAEIENVLLEHGAIAEVAVVGVPDDKWGEIAVCFFRPAPGQAPSRAELVAHLRSQLAAPKTPAHFIAVDSFPMTGSGKIQKFALRERFVKGEFAQRL
jgi:fatty-acyl-CoA synthase